MNIEKMERRRNVQGQVYALLADDPNALDAVMAAMTSGMREAIERANARASTYDQAMMAALCLLDGKRISEDVREALGKTILRGAMGGSKVEQNMQERFGARPAEAAE